MDADRKEKTITLRIEEGMFKQLKKQADKELRTISNYIRKVLTEDLSKKKKS